MAIGGPNLLAEALHFQADLSVQRGKRWDVSPTCFSASVGA
jgi:hypothetical protein